MIKHLLMALQACYSEYLMLKTPFCESLTFMRFLLDDFALAEQSHFGTAWMLFSDQVMDGASQGQISHECHEDKTACLHLQGDLNPGERNGFLQLALPLVASRYLFDARHFKGVELTCRATSPTGYWLLLRTKELSMPWQHFRAPLLPTPEWGTHQIPFADFVSFQTSHELNLERLSRLAILAGAPLTKPDLHLAEIGFY